MLTIGFSSQASLFDQLPLSNEINESQQKQFSKPYRCIEMIDDYLQVQKAQQNLLSSRSSKGREKQLTPSDIALIIQQKALCYYHADQVDQAIVNLDKILQDGYIILPQNLIQQTLLIKSFILSNSDKLTDQESAYKALSRIKTNIHNNTYDPTLRTQFILKTIEGNITLKLGDYDKALTLLQEAEADIRQINRPDDLAWSLYYLGNFYQQTDKLELANDYYLKALQQLTNKDDILTGILADKISQVYVSQDNFKLAISYANQSAQFYQNLGNKIKLSSSLLRLASIHRLINENNLSLVYYFNALDLLKTFNATDKLGVVYFEVGKTYLQMGNFKLAQQYLTNAYHLFEVNGEYKNKLQSQVQLAILAIQQKDFSTAQQLLNEALSIARTLNDNSLFETVYLYLGIAYEETQQYPQALQSYKQFFRYKQLNTFEKRQIIPQPQQNKEQDEIKKQKITQLLVQQNQLEKYNNSLYFSLFIVILILCFTLYFSVMLYKKNKQQRLSIVELEDSVYRNPFTGINNIRSFAQEIPTPLQEARLFSDWEHGEKKGKSNSCALIGLDFLHLAREKYSIERMNEIETQLGSLLRAKITDSERLFQISDTQLLYIKPKDRNYTPTAFAEMIIAWFNELNIPAAIGNQVSVGIVSYPFLVKYPTAIDYKKLLNIAALALSGATQLSRQTGQTNWVELCALKYTQPAFFHGNIWERAKQATEKGLIKVTASTDKNSIKWD